MKVNKKRRKSMIKHLLTVTGVLAIVSGCSSENKICSIDTPTHCQEQRSDTNQTTFLASTIYFKQNLTSLKNDDKKAINSIAQFQQTFNADIKIIAYPISETNDIALKRIKEVEALLKQKNISYKKIKYEIGSSTEKVYSNAKNANTPLSRRVEIYITY